MKRREFIRLGGFLTVSAAAIGMTGCDPVGDSSDTSASALDPTLYPTPTRPMPAAASGAGWYFPQSVASADPKPDSIVLWTRVLDTAASDTDVATQSVAITLRVTAADNSGSLGSNAALTGALVAEVTVPAYVDYDGTLRHKLIGLDDDTVYYYQFQAGDVLSNVGRFRTAPAAAATRDVKFAFMACQDWSSNHWGVFEDIVARDATDNLDFLVHLGDYIYETDNAGAASLETRHGVISFPDGVAVPPPKAGDAAPGGNYASTTNDYRYLYKLYRSDLRLQAVHERFAIIAVWDDHEFSDDAWQSAETYTNQNNGDVSRRRNANQAWFEFMPADVTFQETNPSFQNIQLYRDFKFGETMHLVMTDERLYKQDHLIPETTLSPLSGLQLGRINSRYLAPEGSMKIAEAVKDAASPNLTLLTMLGATQREWWKTTMSSATSKWKVWGNEVSLLRMGLNGTKAVGTLIALQAISGLQLTMTQTGGGTFNGTPYTGDATVKNLPRVAACAGTLITGSGGAIPAANAILLGFGALQVLSAAGDVSAWLQSQGVSAPLATSAATALATTTPSALQEALCGAAVAACTTAYMTTGTSKTAASTAAAGNVVGMLLNDPSLNAADPVITAVLTGSTGISSGVAGVLVNVWKAARAVVLAAGTQATLYTNAAGAFAGVTMLMAIRAEVEGGVITPPPALASTSSFVTASGMLPSLFPFFRKFLINADQWDGYAKERKQLMSYLADQGIDNVVAVTGDIHAFFAGTVHNEFPGEILTVDASGNEVTASAGTPAVMVDLVTAGVSSTSWYNYLNAAAAALSASLTTLVSYTLPSAATGLPFDLKLPVLDFSLGKAFSPTALVTMITDAIRDGAAAAGVPEGALPAIGTVASTIAGNPSLQFLCVSLSVMGQEVNPWLKHIDTNAQGYSVVTASSSSLVCDFRHVNAAFFNGRGGVPGIDGNTYAPGKAPADARGVVSRVVRATVSDGSADVAITVPV